MSGEAVLTLCEICGHDLEDGLCENPNCANAEK